MKQYFYTLIVIILLCACESESTQIGSNFFEDSALDFSLLDTVSVNLATVKYDELITNAPSRLLVGNHVDETIGTVSSTAYFELSGPGTTSLTASNSTYNYLVLVLKYDGYSLYDTTLLNTFNVYRVAEEMEEDDDGHLYNHSSFSHLIDPLGNFTFAARPHGDSIAIKLDDALGQELYSLLLAQADETSIQSSFLKYFRGIAVVPDNTVNGSMVGFSVDAEMRLYYIDKSQVPNDKDVYISFPLNTSGTYFNQISSDTKNTALAGQLTDQEDRLAAELTADEAFIQGGTGLALRVDFPHVKNLNGLNNIYITRATLDIYPTHRSYSDLTPLPTSLSAYVIYPTNETCQTFHSNIQLVTETELPRDSYYRLDVTSFIQSLISDTGDKDDQYGLLFRLDDAEYTASVNRIFAGNAKTKLNIYFATIKNN